MKNQEWWEFTEQAKRQGKIRFRGMSGHGGDLVECLEYAIDQNLVDVILVAYNFGQDPSFTDKVRHTFHWAAIQPDLPPMLAKAKQKDIGVIAMKTLMGGRLNDMRPYERPGGTFPGGVPLGAFQPKRRCAGDLHDQQVEIDEYVVASGDRE